MEWLWSLLGALVIGALAGWFASQVMRGRGFGLIGDIILGIVGAIVAQLLFVNLLNLTWFSTWGWVGNLIWAILGAIIVLAVAKLFRRGTT
jgi:uncharacterized membrane protein YeaQ/YmgE (transglycosylase-associated protein family)